MTRTTSSKKTQPYQSLGELHSHVLKLVRDGNQIAQFHVGEPDYSIHPDISSSIPKIISDNPMGYSETQGIYALRAKIAEDLQVRKGVNVSPDEIIITTGAKFSLYLLFKLLCRVGDEVIIPVPVWSTYPFLTENNGGIPKYIPTLLNGDLCLDSLAQTITDKTTLLVLCSPHNPTGTIPSLENLTRLADILVKYPKIMVISDEIYEKMDWCNKHVSFSTYRQLQGRVITVNGFSKSEGLTGLRVGYTVAPPHLISKMTRLQSQSVSCCPTLSQHIALRTYLHPNHLGREQLRKNRNICQTMLADCQVWSMDGGFYCFLSVSPRNDREVTDELLTKYHISVAPGYLFKYPGYIRISYATSEDTLRTGLAKIKWYLQSDTTVK